MLVHNSDLHDLIVCSHLSSRHHEEKRGERKEEKREERKEERGKERKSKLRIQILGEQIMISIHILTHFNNFNTLILYVDVADVELFLLE